MKWYQDALKTTTNYEIRTSTNKTCRLLDTKRKGRNFNGKFSQIGSISKRRFMAIKIEATVWWFWLGVAHFCTAWPVTDPMNKNSTILTCNLTSIVSCPVC